MKDSGLYPFVYVLTLNWNTKEMTIECIHSVLMSDYPNFKVVVVDNDSSDGSCEAFEKEFKNKIDIIKADENLGYGRGMNFGMEYAAKYKPDYFFIMNNDVKIDKSAISEMVRCSKNYDDNCLITGKVYHYDSPNILQEIGGYRNRKTLKVTKIAKNIPDEGQFDEEAERDAIDDIFMLFPMKVFIDVGGYSSYFFMNYEQADLAIRVKDKGYKLIYCPKAKLWHKGSHSTGGKGNPKMMYWGAQSRVILHYLNQNRLEFLKFYFLYLYSLLKQLLKKIIFSCIGKRQDFLTTFASMRGFISATLWIFNKKDASDYNPFT